MHELKPSDTRRCVANRDGYPQNVGAQYPRNKYGLDRFRQVTQRKNSMQRMVDTSLIRHQTIKRRQ